MLPECPLFSTTGELLNPDLDRKVEELFTQLMDGIRFILFLFLLSG